DHPVRPGDRRKRGSAGNAALMRSREARPLFIFRPDRGDGDMKLITVPAALAISALVLSGCATDSGPKQGFGTLLGGVGGAVAGAQFGSGTGRLVSVAAGTMLGSLVGSEVGKSLDRADQAYAYRSATSALEYAPAGHATTWRNPDSG